jgi:hypothetical protein
LLKTNKDKLVKMSVIGEVVSPTVGASIYRVSADGEPMILPGVGGITYNVRLGDLVAIVDADHSYGRIYRKGAMSVSIVTHSDCVTAGHGPGTTTLFTSKTGAIKPVIDADANIAKILGLRDDL